MYTKFKRRVLPIIMSIIIIFSCTYLNYQEAKADILTIAAGVSTAAGGITVGGLICVALGIVAVSYGCYLVIDNWDEITRECSSFLQKADVNVRTWWNDICQSAVPKDEGAVPLPEKLQTPGEVINFFDYYLPNSGGSGGDPGKGDKMELNPKVLGALYSFLLTYYAVEALDPDEVFSNQAISSMSIQQLSKYIDYQPAAEELIIAYNKSLADTNGYQTLKDLGLLYVLLTPRKPISLYEANTPIYGILDVPDLSDTIFVGVKDDGSCAIFTMGFTGSAVTNSSGGYQLENFNQYNYPYYPSGIDLYNEPFMSTLHTRYDAAYYYPQLINGALTYSWASNISGTKWVNSKYFSDSYTSFNAEKISEHSVTSSPYFNLPLSAYYRHYDRGNNLTQQYYYIWDNVQYNNGNLIMGDYNVNFVGGRDYFHFYKYDYEEWLNNKAYYFQCFKNLTKMKGTLESYAGTTFKKFIPGESYTIPESDYKIIIPENQSVNLDINPKLLEELSKVNASLDKNFDRIIKAINNANKYTLQETGKPTIDKIIIDNNTTPDPGNVNVDLSETNALIEGLPSSIAEAINLPGSLSDAFTPSGDFTNLGNIGGSLGNFFNFDILYEYHEMIETFFTQRIGNNSPPVFSIYPKQSGLVYFGNMPEKVDVIDFNFMEKEVFTWGITIRYFIRCILTFFVFCVWLNRTIKKLPGVISGL